MNNAAQTSNDNYNLKLKHKIQRKEFYMKLLKQINDQYNKKIKDRKYRYHHNKDNIFPSNNIKNSILLNFEAQIIKHIK